MRKKLFKNLVSFALFMLIVMPVLAAAFALPASAQVDPWGDVEPDEIQNITGFGDRDPREIAASVINVVLGFLGIVAVVIILIGGFKWMTAGGNEDKTTEARNLIQAGAIGLVIILASFGIAKFVLDSLLTATS